MTADLTLAIFPARALGVMMMLAGSETRSPPTAETVDPELITTNRRSFLFSLAAIRETLPMVAVRFFLLLLIAATVVIAAILPTRDNRREAAAVVPDVPAIVEVRLMVRVATAATAEIAVIAAVLDTEPETDATAVTVEMADMEAVRDITPETDATAAIVDAVEIVAALFSRRV